jgi:malonate transporter and related proteins
MLRLVAGQPLDRVFNPVFYGGYLASGGLIFAGVLGLRGPLAGRTSPRGGRAPHSHDGQ